MIKAKLREGDIIVTDCIGHELCQHLGIVYKSGNNVFVFHNAPTNLNKFGGTIVSEPYEEYKKMRQILKVIPTGIKNHQILHTSRKYKHDVWDSMFFNCEDFVYEIAYGRRESNIRYAYQIAAIGVGILLII